MLHGRQRFELADAQLVPKLCLHRRILVKALCIASNAHIAILLERDWLSVRRIYLQHSHLALGENCRTAYEAAMAARAEAGIAAISERAPNT